MHDLRRNDYDVTNSVQVSSTAAVTTAVRELFTAAFPGESFDRVATSFEEFDKLFTGRMPGYHGVDTIYHDRQHSLDMTLAMARLLVGTSAPSRLACASGRAVGHGTGHIAVSRCGIYPGIRRPAASQWRRVHPLSMSPAAPVFWPVPAEPSALENWVPGVRPESCTSRGMRSNSTKSSSPTPAIAN